MSRRLRFSIFMVWMGVTLGVTGFASGAEGQFHVIFGTNETVERAWDGQVRVTAGRLERLRPWKFQKPDALTSPVRWQCRTRWIPARRVSQSEPNSNAPRPGYLQRPGLLLHVTFNEQTRIELETPHGTVSFTPAAFAPTSTKLLLDGQIRVTMAPVESRLSDEGSFDDHPAIVAGSDGEICTAWISYGRDADTVVARRYTDGSWDEPETISPEPGDHHRVDLARDGGGRLWAVWSAQRDGNWDLYARVHADGQWMPVQRITTDPGPDIHPQLASRNGHVALVWQSARDGNAWDILAAALNGDRFGTPVRVSPSEANDWEPDVTLGPDGKVWVAWDGYARGNYDVFLRSFEMHDGRLTSASEVIDVADSPLYETHPSIDVDPAGRVWIAYHEGGIEWGKDTGFWTRREGSELYSERFVRVVCIGPEGRRFPAEAIQSEFPYELRQFCDYPQLEVDDDGRVWVFFRHRTLLLWSGYSNAAHRAIWEIYATYYTGDRWSPPVYLPSSFGRNDMRMRTTVDDTGRVWAVWPDDGREPAAPKGYLPQRADVHAAPLARPTTSATTPKLQSASEAESFTNVVHPDEAADVARVRAYRADVGGKTYRIVRGDFHRHTDISHDGNRDGSLLEAYRYASDAAAQDLLGVTDHDYGATDYDWWRIQKAVDLYHVPGRFVPMFTYERSLGYPNGHRNIVHAVRGVRPLLRTESPKGNTGPVLYPHLRETGGIAMSHTSGTNMGTDWRDNDPELEPVVEIFQGDRNSYEHEGAPLAATGEAPELHRGGYRPKGYVWNAWAKGFKLGVQASSDHVSTHCSYACLYVSDFTREGILDALRRRHCYGATDNILMDVRLVTPDGEHLMGDIVTTDASPRFKVTLDGTGPIRVVHVIKNNAYVYQKAGDGDTITFTFHDTNPTAGESYYYVRVEQTDGHVGWSSPIWVVRQ